MDSNRLYEIFVEERCRVVTDSRVVTRGDIFFALKGSSFNGNLFAAEAIKRGARLAVVEEEGIYGEKIYKVDDSLAELQNLASKYRHSFDIPVLAITGSNGKTTTKEVVSAILSRAYNVHRTPGNLNNHIGVPLTILSAPYNADFLLIEMGANHIGEIKRLCAIADPDAGIITNIGRAHLEGFGTEQGIIDAKSELYEYISDRGGVILYNERNEVLLKLVDSTDVKAYTYNRPGTSTVNLVDSSFKPTLTLTIDVDGSQYEIATQLFGQHNIENIRAAIACGIYYNVPLNSIIEAVSDYRPENNRSQVMITPHNTVICDSYNANPTSMGAAIESTLTASDKPITFILGDMLELGDFSVDEHCRILKRLAGVPGIKVMLVGPIFSDISQNYGFRSFKDVSDLVLYLSENPIRDNFVLVKGSRGISLEKIYHLL